MITIIKSTLECSTKKRRMLNIEEDAEKWHLKRYWIKHKGCQILKGRKRVETVRDNDLRNVPSKANATQCWRGWGEYRQNIKQLKKQTLKRMRRDGTSRILDKAAPTSPHSWGRKFPPLSTCSNYDQKYEISAHYIFSIKVQKGVQSK